MQDPTGSELQDLPRSGATAVSCSLQAPAGTCRLLASSLKGSIMGFLYLLLKMMK